MPSVETPFLSLPQILAGLDYGAVFVFGMTGALAAARRKHDIVTFAFFAAVTGVGGGTLRDLLIGAPVFWVARPAYLLVTTAAAVAVWIVAVGRRRERLLVWLDALGSAAYTIVGALKALSFGLPPLTAVVMGVLTATFGGIIRDVLAEEPSALLKRELTVTPALAGATLFATLSAFDVPNLPAGLAGFVLAFGVRAGAILWGWQMPAFRGRGLPPG